MGGIALWLAIYSVLLLRSAVPSSQWCCPSYTNLGRFGHCFLPRKYFPGGIGVPNGMLDTVFLLSAGSFTIPHLISFMQSKKLHRLHHVYAHSFVFMMGVLSASLRWTTNAIDATFPVTVLCISLLHSQNNSDSAAISFIYAMVMMLFAVCRLAAIFNARLALFSCFFGLWSGTLVLLSAAKGVEAWMELGLDAGTIG